MEKINIKNSFSKTFDVHLCEQCGRCSSACPMTGIDEFNIRKIIRSIEISEIDKVIKTGKPWKCLSCGRCEEACPNGIKTLDLLRSMRKQVPKHLFPETPVPCIKACPVGINIPSFIRKITQESEDEAIKEIFKKTPIPRILGRICNKPCELKCKRNKIDEPISICNLKRYVSDFENNFIKEIYRPGKETNKKILIFGSGPSGLSASYYLRKKGHNVTILEKNEKPGGMLRYGIPRYRLPKEVLNNEINRILNMGITLKTNVEINDSLKNKLVKNNFDAILIAIGLQDSYTIPVDKKFTKKITYGLDFLAKKQQKLNSKKEVLIVGGGNVAIDVAMSTLRLGFQNVTVACLETLEDMPADKSEIEIAIEEGINFLNSWGIKQFVDNGTSINIELIKCKSVFDNNNNFNPQFGSKTINFIANQVIIAIGQTYDKKSIDNLSSFLDNKINIKKGLIYVNSIDKLIKGKNFFATGDIINGPTSVASAVASGRKVAAHIDQFLGGNGIFEQENTDFDETSTHDFKHLANFSYIKRQKTDKRPKVERIKCFSEIKFGFNKKQAKLEGCRCLCCDLEYEMACV